MYGRSDRFLAKVVWKHWLYLNFLVAETSEEKITHLKCFGVNFITYPTTFFRLGKKVHVSMCQLGFMMGEKNKNACIRDRDL
jgi:hypothetical protein